VALKYVDLLFSDTPVSRQTVALQGDYFTLVITYNETMKLYTMTVYDSNQQPLVAGVGLVPNYPIIGDYQIKGLTGAFVLLPKTDQDKEFYKLYPEKISEYYTFHYIYDDSTE
jgi:hypothetical protein